MTGFAGNSFVYIKIRSFPVNCFRGTAGFLYFIVAVCLFFIKQTYGESDVTADSRDVSVMFAHDVETLF